MIAAAPAGLEQARAVLAATRDRLLADAGRIQQALDCLDEVWRPGGADAPGVIVATPLRNPPVDDPVWLAPVARAEEATNGNEIPQGRAAPEDVADCDHAGHGPREAGPADADGARAHGGPDPEPPARPGAEAEGRAPAAVAEARPSPERGDPVGLMLNERERAVMMQLWRARDGECRAVLSQRDLAQAAGIPTGSMTPVMRSLMDLRLIRLAKPADATTPATWLLLCDPDGNPAKGRCAP